MIVLKKFKIGGKVYNPGDSISADEMKKPEVKKRAGYVMDLGDAEIAADMLKEQEKEIAELEQLKSRAQNRYTAGLKKDRTRGNKYNIDAPISDKTKAALGEMLKADSMIFDTQCKMAINQLAVDAMTKVNLSKTAEANSTIDLPPDDEVGGDDDEQ